MKNCVLTAQRSTDSLRFYFWFPVSPLTFTQDLILLLAELWIQSIDCYCILNKELPSYWYSRNMHSINMSYMLPNSARHAMFCTFFNRDYMCCLCSACACLHITNAINSAPIYVYCSFPVETFSWHFGCTLTSKKWIVFSWKHHMFWGEMLYNQMSEYCIHSSARSPEGLCFQLNCQKTFL